MITSRMVAMAGIVVLTGGLVACVSENQRNIVIDGRFDDWVEVPVLVNTEPQHTPGVTAISLTHDENSVFVRLDLDGKVNMQNLLDGTLAIYFDADDDPETGTTDSPLAGADIAIELSPLNKRWPGRPRQGARIVIFDQESETPRIESAYSIGFLSAPTHSASQFEFRFARGSLTTGKANLFRQDRLRGMFVQSMDPEHIIQQSPEFVYPLSASGPPITPTSRQIETVLTANELDTIRVLSWNIADHDFQRNFDAFGRILSAIKPDVLLLDEAPQGVTEEIIRKLLLAMDPTIKVSDWQVQIGLGGGRQRGVVTSHLAFENLPEYDPLHYPEDVVEYIRTNGSTTMRRDLVDMHREGMPILGVQLDWAGHKLSLATMDFQCCGYDGSPEDEFRIRQARVVRQAMSDGTRDSGAPDAWILAGDLNLVGSRRPLEILLEAGDLDGSDLVSVNPLQLNLATTATYGFRGTFPPGQLDFMIFSDSSLELVRSFVFDSRDLPDNLANELGVNIDDSSHSSDHMPIVADFRFR